MPHQGVEIIIGIMDELCLSFGVSSVDPGKLVFSTRFVPAVHDAGAARAAERGLWPPEIGPPHAAGRGTVSVGKFRPFESRSRNTQFLCYSAQTSSCYTSSSTSSQLSRVTGTTIDECKYLCNQQDSCYGFDFASPSSSGGTCILRSSTCSGSVGMCNPAIVDACYFLRTNCPNANRRRRLVSNFDGDVNFARVYTSALSSAAVELLGATNSRNRRWTSPQCR